MPEMGRLEFQQKLVVSGSSLPIIFMTAHEDISACEKGFKAGAIAFLHKPFEDQVLIENVNLTLSRFVDDNHKENDQGSNKNES